MTHVVVIGAGIIGAATAFELLKAGHQVTIIEPETPGGKQSASYGNGAWISPASIIPMSMPGLWRKVPGYLLNKNGPITIRWAHFVKMIPWLTRFIWAGATRKRAAKTARLLASLLNDAPQRHATLAKEVDRSDLIIQTGLIYAYPNKSDFENEQFSWQLRRQNGIVWSEYNGEELRQLEPALSKQYKFGVYLPAGAHCKNPGEYVTAITEKCRRLGAQIITGKVTGYELEDNVLKAVIIGGDVESRRVECHYAVLSAGIWSKDLAAFAGDNVPLQSERGYHGIILDPKVKLKTPVMPSDGKMANTSTSSGLRLAGQVELANVDAEPNWARVEVLIRHAIAAYPDLGKRDELATHVWFGHRPSTPDGLPVIGRSTHSDNIIYAFGHGHVGLASGPKTADLVTRLISNTIDEAELLEFSVSRFR